MSRTKLHGLFHSLCHYLARVALVQFKHGHKFPHTPSIRIPLPHGFQQVLVIARSGFCAIGATEGMLKCTWTFFKQFQIGQGIQYIPLTPKATCGGCHDLEKTENFHPERVRPACQLSAHVFGGDRITVGLEHKLAVWIHLHHVRAASLIIAGSQRQEGVSF